MKISSQTALQEFINQNYQRDFYQLSFQKSLVFGFDNQFVLNQLYGKRKAKLKFPFLFKNPNIHYPTKVALEQSSSQIAASWKANLVEGKSLLDMTGGLGIDAYFFSKKVKTLTYIEKNQALFDIATHNFKVLEANNIQSLNEDAVAYLKQIPHYFDWIYIDPARRDEYGGRKIGLEGYTPNLLKINTLLLDKAKNILVKVSPMLDIQQGISQLKYVQKVMIFAIQNEVKELLFILKNELQNTIQLACINVRKGGEISQYTTTYNTQTTYEPTYTIPKTYIYEPNAAIRKAGVFNQIAVDYELYKLHPNTHLYTSDELISDFPGRIFKCKTIRSFNKKDIKPHLENGKANITTRNFPYSTAAVKKKLALKDGGNIYLFATTLLNKKLSILICEKINIK